MTGGEQIMVEDLRIEVQEARGELNVLQHRTEGVARDLEEMAESLVRVSRSPSVHDTAERMKALSRSLLATVQNGLYAMANPEEEAKKDASD